MVHSTQACARLAADTDDAFVSVENPVDWDANRAELMEFWRSGKSS